VKSLMWVLMAGALVVSTPLVATLEAGDHGRRGWKHDRDRRDRDDRRRGRDDRYFRDRDVVVIREYYRPHYRALPRGLRHRYYRIGYLQYGWHRRMRPVPVYIERELVVLPHGYHRGIIDGHAVIYNSRGMIVDVAVLF